jgi:endonuclease I
MDYLIGLGEDIYSDLPIYGDIDDLLRWHEEDPISEAEARRNDVIYSYQGNRNPFIDYPDLVQLIWGSSDNPIEQN